MSVLIDLERVSARTPDRPLFVDLSLTISTGQRLGVVGINGTGKSTLLRVLAGVADPDDGEVRRGRGVRVAYLDQEPTLPSGTVRDAVGGGWEGAATLERLGMGAAMEANTSELSGGEIKRVALARTLVSPAELLILDEPTNHLDLSAVAWLEVHLRTYAGGLVLVSHDRHLLDRTTTLMVELDRGARYVHEGGYASYLEARAEREERSANAESVRRNLARRELAWLRRGAPARTSKSKTRIERATALIDARQQAPARSNELALTIGTPRLGDKVIELSGASFARDGRQVITGVDLLIGPDERLGVVGMNGTGKSTLLDLLSGRRSPTAGSVETGPTVVVGYYDQLGASFDPDARVQDVVAGPRRTAGSREDIALMERFWFSGDLPFARVGSLSGGERRRLQLLVVLAQRPNVLLLDEPTNDLDLDTLRILEAFLEEWPGALVAVSHDRTFLERTTTRLVALDPDHSVRAIGSDLDAWLEEERTAGVRRRERGRASTPDTRRPSARSASTIAHEVRQVEREIARLERSRDELAEELVGVVEHDQLRRIGIELTDVTSWLAAAEEEWLTLAEESESAG